MNKVRADALNIGDKIMPPAREVQLWMRRHLAEKGLQESALHLTIKTIVQAASDKRGRWLAISAEYSPEWIGNGRVRCFNFKARPETPWPKIA